jgi:hypothetical protein
LSPKISGLSLYKRQDIENHRERTLQAFFNHLKKRAFGEGYAAYKNKVPRHAPARFGVYAGYWTAGYDQAALDAHQALKS